MLVVISKLRSLLFPLLIVDFDHIYLCFLTQLSEQSVY